MPDEQAWVGRLSTGYRAGCARGPREPRIVWREPYIGVRCYSLLLSSSPDAAAMLRSARGVGHGADFTYFAAASLTIFVLVRGLQLRDACPFPVESTGYLTRSPVTSACTSLRPDVYTAHK